MIVKPLDSPRVVEFVVLVVVESLLLVVWDVVSLVPLEVLLDFVVLSAVVSVVDCDTLCDLPILLLVPSFVPVWMDILFQ